jgi:hypothetical protein
MNYIKLATLSVVALLSSMASLSAGGGVKIGHILVGVVTCTGGNSNCSITQTTGVNAIGDPFTMNPVKATPIHLGTIDQETLKSLTLPENVDGHTLYSFIPSKGELAGKTIYLALRKDPKVRRGLAHEGETPVEILRFVQGGNPAKEWFRMGFFYLKQSSAMSEESAGKSVESVDLAIMPDGNAHTQSPDGKDIVFHSGEKIMK